MKFKLPESAGVRAALAAACGCLLAALLIAGCDGCAAAGKAGAAAQDRTSAVAVRMLAAVAAESPADAPAAGAAAALAPPAGAAVDPAADRRFHDAAAPLLAAYADAHPDEKQAVDDLLLTWGYRLEKFGG